MATLPKSAPVASTRALPKPLPLNKVFNPCPTTVFDFTNTSEVKANHDIIAQNRAIQAINVGLGIRRPGYNIYVAGIQGTGKTSVIRQFLERWSANSPPPNDWIYLYNFQSPETPRAIELPRGEGKVLRKKMETLVKSFRAEIPLALQSEDYENAVNAFISLTNDRKSKLFLDLEKLAKSMDFVIKSSRLGIETIPVFEGRPLSEKEYNKLSDESRDDIEKKRNKLEPEVLDFARKVRAIEQEAREQLEKMRQEIGNQVVSALIDPLLGEYEQHPDLYEYLGKVKEDVLENLLDFVDDDEGEGEEGGVDHEYGRDKFSKYKINVFIDNSQQQTAPVVIETNPTYYNLFGKVEKNVEHGMYLTDFTMIKPGAIHKANGGYLVLNALDIFKSQHNLWDPLKRILRNRTAFIEDMGEQFSLLPTSGVRPEPIPLDLKVILIGNDEIYHLLYSDDEEFPKIFKIKADFDFKMERSKRNIDAYVSFISTRANVEGLLPFDRSGVAAIVEFSSRLVEDQRLLSTQFSEIKDLTIEADYIARQNNARLIKRDHVEEAMNQKYYRLNLQEENLLEMVKSRDILVSVDGDVIGQINGLAVYDYGDYSFGKIGRITCTTSISENGIINIERASHLSGRIHDKGVYILSGFIHSILAQEHRLGLSASVCFEQSYGIIDGDSASVAELIAIISAMAGIPVKQNFAITGSINQMGEVQSIGGVNEKIEGFFKVCKTIGQGKSFGVIIPEQNIPNLMLHEELREAVKEGWFHIYGVAHIWQAFELITGVPLGLKSVHDRKEFAKGSALATIQTKLSKIHNRDKKNQAAEGDEEDADEDQEKAAKSRRSPRKKQGARS